MPSSTSDDLANLDNQSGQIARSWQIFFTMWRALIGRFHLHTELKNKSWKNINYLIFSQEFLKSCCGSWRMWQKFSFRGNCCINRIKKGSSRLLLLLQCSACKSLFSWITLPRSKRTSKNNCLPSCLLCRGAKRNTCSSATAEEPHFLWTAYSSFDSFMQQSFTIQIEYSSRTTCILSIFTVYLRSFWR